MEPFMAAFSTADITPDNLGFPMYGYSGREGNSAAVHDPLLAKTMVVRRGSEAWSLTVLDLIGIDAGTVSSIRSMVAEQTGLRPQSIMVACIHTHSGPSVRDEGNWDRPFAGIVAEAITEAWRNLQPAKAAIGAGFLYGYHVNRRWMERPVDPSVNVLRFDDLQGTVLGVAANFGLHPVVMGYDNLSLSADYVGAARNVVEREYGCPCLFANGAAANVNPITRNVRRQLAERRSFVTMTGAFYYGRSRDTIELADRIGGTFEEVEEIGQAVGDQIACVASGLKTEVPTTVPWSLSLQVPHSDQNDETIEVMALGFSEFILIGEPGEVYVETGLELKERVRKLGYRFPWVVSYANDWQSYLSPESAFDEGGYEVAMSQHAKHSPQLQSRLWAAVAPGIPRAAPATVIRWQGFNADTSEEED